MKKIMVFLFILGGSIAQAQTTNSSDIVEGGKVVLEFFKLFKSSDSKAKNSDCKKLNFSNIYVENKLGSKIKVLLTDKSKEAKSYELIIQDGSKESVLEINASTYLCVITNTTTGEVIKKGDMKIEPCKDLAVKIK